ncbi:hypothetical protein QNH20_03055 [Neobacillus sp. WH10]|uniref:hypothetical protein n=1 Tax=Neobacillus sp. WH10 TaxID=3047873 RepID=UPI0024C20540|nr:hypothetical protein [Neobacillus sp. WH10]WHY78159.1 hypothetical protein QNH20_03055 [Neobacillus sp. WH10]
MDFSVGVYKNINNNTLILVPDGFNQDGIRCNINKPAMLKEPYKPALIGEKLKECFKITINHQYTDEYMKVIVTRLVTGEKNDKKFVKNHLFQLVFFNKDNGFEFEAKMVSKDGRGYTLKPNTSALVLDEKASDTELGEAVLRTFETCKLI